jgi:phosphomannomutase
MQHEEIALSDEAKKTQSAEAQNRKLQRAEDGRKAMAEYEAEAAATRAKTERLRALRLARDAANPAAAAPAKKATKTAGKTAGKTAAQKKPGKRAPAKLADWLDDQQEGGHRS